MGKNGRKQEREAKPTGDKYAKREAEGISLDRQFLSALCPAPPDDGLAPGTAHPLQEPVGSFSFSIMGFIGDAHFFSSVIASPSVGQASRLS